MSWLRRLWLWGPLLALAAGIFYLSSGPLPEAIAPGPDTDKIAHFSVYGVLGALLARALLGSGVRYAVFFAALGGALYGVSDEIHQMFVPGRSAEVLDAVADAAGSLIGAGAYAMAAAWIAGRRAQAAPPAT